MRDLSVLSIAVGALLLVGVSMAEAVPVVSHGRPVVSIGSGTGAVPDCPSLEGQSCYNTATGSVTFFIPLSTDHAGIFGVTNVGNGRTAGTFADSGGGTENSNALTMFLRFSPVAAAPLSLGSLRFDFVDLDLQGVNDPNGFFESVRFYSSSGSALTDRITMINQGQGGSSLPFTVVGNSNSQSIIFGDVRSLVQNPFYIELRFRTSYNSTGTNTPESMIATLTTETESTPPPPPQRVPEPGTLGLLGAGLIVLAAVLRPTGGRRNRTPKGPSA